MQNIYLWNMFDISLIEIQITLFSILQKDLQKSFIKNLYSEIAVITLLEVFAFVKSIFFTY